jgi:hypothetical protein
MELLDLLLLVGSLDEGRAKMITTLEAAGAITPATARPFAELDVAGDKTWTQLVREGRIREGPPGYFYVFEGARRSSPREKRIKQIVFYALIVAIPIVLILLNKQD